MIYTQSTKVDDEIDCDDILVVLYELVSNIYIYIYVDVVWWQKHNVQ